jgi:hypothetical protein
LWGGSHGPRLRAVGREAGFDFPFSWKLEMAFYFSLELILDN